MGQTWEHLLFAHWRVDEAALRRVVPGEIPIDTFDGSAWLGVTPFIVTGMRVRPMPPIPGAARFPEINVRTYSTIDDRPGIYFFSLDTPKRIAVAAARRVYRLPYFRSQIEAEVSAAGTSYRSDRVDDDAPPAQIDVNYRPTGPAHRPRPGSFEHWAVERYCLYTLNDDARLLRGDIHHPPWALQPAQADFARNSMAEQVGIELAASPTVHLAARQDVVFWLNESIAPAVAAHESARG
jgi:uncharacterized protein YqjF (DUF2071 family)